MFPQTIFWQQTILAGAALVLLYLTRQGLARELGRLLKNPKAFIWLWSMIFLPGTIVHELSHFFAAALTGTRTGKIEIFPEIPHDRDTIHLGYVQTQQLGLIRGFIVGTAPLFVGLGLLVWISSALEFSNFKFQISNFLQVYLFFTVANSLFPSWQDLKFALPLVVVAAILGGGLYFLGIRPEIVTDSRLVMLLNSLWKALAASAGVNLVILTIFKIINGARRS